MNSLNIKDKSSNTFSTLYTNINQLKIQIGLIEKNIKLTEKKVNSELKKINKKVDKINNKSKSTKKPSGFAHPTPVTKQLCEFLNKTEGTHLARTEVTKSLISYIKENNLQEENAKIVPDEKLRALLKLTPDELDNLTFFNIQKYMNKHFSYTSNSSIANIVSENEDK